MLRKRFVDVFHVDGTGLDCACAAMGLVNVAAIERQACQGHLSRVAVRLHCAVQSSKWLLWAASRCNLRAPTRGAGWSPAGSGCTARPLHK